MRIIVLIKAGAELEESDACAVEQALRIARRRIDTRVSVLTAGPADCARALRAALALGADDGVHVADERISTSDALTLSRVLATAIRDLGFDLVLCGATTQTPNLSVVPAMVAERLGVPALCHAERIDLGFDSITALCDEGATLVELAAELPALVSVTGFSVPPRYPPFPAVVEARHKLIITRSLDQSSPFSPNALMHSNRTLCPRSNTIIKADRDPHTAAARLADFLAERQFI